MRARYPYPWHFLIESMLGVIIGIVIDLLQINLMRRGVTLPVFFWSQRFASLLAGIVYALAIRPIRFPFALWMVAGPLYFEFALDMNKPFSHWVVVQSLILILWAHAGWLSVWFIRRYHRRQMATVE